VFGSDWKIVAEGAICGLGGLQDRIPAGRLSGGEDTGKVTPGWVFSGRHRPLPLIHLGANAWCCRARSRIHSAVSPIFLVWDGV
jgi:hypothetical protein